MLQLGCWNINGFSIEKINDVNIDKFDIFGITESWTSSESNIALPGFKAIHEPGIKKKGKKGRRSGGIILYIKQHLTKNNGITKIHNDKQFIWLKISKKIFGTTHDIFLCCLYIKPRITSISPEHDALFEKLTYFINKYSNQGKIILMGDFNSRSGSLDDFIKHDDIINDTCNPDLLPDSYNIDIPLQRRNNLDRTINEQGKNLIEMCIETKLRILNGRVIGDSLGYNTYYSPRGNSTVDYFIVSEDIFYEFVFMNVLPPNELSDHSILWACLKSNFTNTFVQDDDSNFDMLPGKFDIDSGSKLDFISALKENNTTCLVNEFLLEVNNPCADINILSDNLNNIILNSANKCFHFKHFIKKKKTKKKYKKKWFDGNCLFLKRELNNISKKLQKFPDDYHLKSTYHRFRKEYKKMLKDTKHNYFKSIVNTLDTLQEKDPKMFWKTLDNLRQDVKNQENPISISAWVEYLKQLYTDNVNDSSFTLLNLEEDSINNKDLDFAFTCKEVKDGIKNLKRNKQPGIDFIHNEFLIFGKDILLLPIVNLFNRILSSGIFPESWNIACISFLHKNGDIYNCDNYRCLSLTSCMGKLFTSLLQKRLHKYMECNNLYNRFQAGFRPDYRTTDHIFIIKTLINKYLHKLKKPIFTCFVDFSKAFDSVWHIGLFKKLLELKIGGNFYKIIKHMYSNSKFVVKKGKLISDINNLYKGVRQGDGLSPMLFNIYTNDLPEIFDQSKTEPVELDLTKLNCLLYADDLILLSESEKGLQSCLDYLSTYCSRWKLNINISKTKVMVFSKGKRKLSNFKFNINNQTLEVVEKYKYLGVILNFNGNLKHAADHMFNKGLKAVFSLKSRILDFDLAKVKLKLKLFDTLIKPIITYGSEIWISDFTEKELKSDNLPFEKTHNRFCKYILGVHKKSSNFASKCELGRTPILCYINTLAFKYYLRIKQLPSTRILKEAFEVDQGLNLEGKKSWYSFIVNSAKKMNISLVNLSEKGITNRINNYYKKSVIDQLEFLKTHNDSKLNTFANLYQKFELQQYLDFNLPKSISSHLTKLRISAHSLLIEKGRYSRPKTPRNQRLCTNCNEVEDEQHFLLFCKKYDHLRTTLFSHLNHPMNIIKPPNDELSSNFIELLNPKTIQDTKHISNFIQSSFSTSSD